MIINHKSFITMKKKIFFLVFSFYFFIGYSQNEESRFVYELYFEPSPSASIIEAEKQFFYFYDGFKQSKYCTEVIALQHHTGDKLDYKILAFANNWDVLDDMLVDAQTYFAKMDPTMMTAAWKMGHTGDAIYAVRKSAAEGFISQ